MTRLRLVRSNVLTTAQQLEAIFSQPTLYQVAAAVPYRQPVGRPPLHPAWAVLGYGVLARVFRSGARTELELASPGVWPRILELAEEVRAEHPDLDIPPGHPTRPPDWAAWKNARNRYFADPEILAELQAAFTETAVEQARDFGLLDPARPRVAVPPAHHPGGLRRRHRDPTHVQAARRQAAHRPQDRRGDHHLPRRRRQAHRPAHPQVRPRRRGLPRTHRLGARPELRRPLRPRPRTAPTRRRSPSTASHAPALRPTPPWSASSSSTRSSAPGCRRSSTTAPCAAPTSTSS